MSGDERGDRRDDRPTPSVLVEERGALAVIRINRPEQRNSLSVATLSELSRAFSNLAVREDLSAIIFTGTRDAFASGADIRELQTLTPASAREFALRGQELFGRIAGARRLTVAAVNGFCMGGGLDLALACRVRVATPAAVFAHPGARLGIITGWGGTQRLARLVGNARALEMFLTAARIDGRRAHEIGLVDELNEDARGCALRLAEKLTGPRGVPQTY
ncbi:MAG: enoyl-CoA hydratase [Acidobacteriota bacterium]|nr:enoyl-CoA hydratase [Acidobacteriota bacterium]